MKYAKKNPFTLIEILAVVAIIAVLAGMTVGISSLVMDKAAESKTKSAIKILEMALAKYQQEVGHYPIKPGQGMLEVRYDKANPGNDDKLLKFLDEKFLRENTEKFTSGTLTYLRFVDGHGFPLVYRFPGYFNKGKFDLGSAGKDGHIGDGKGTRFKKESITVSFGIYKSDFGKGDDIVNFVNNTDF